MAIAVHDVLVSSGQFFSVSTIESGHLNSKLQGFARIKTR